MKVCVLVIAFETPNAGAGEKAAAEELARAAIRAEIFIFAVIYILGEWRINKWMLLSRK